MTHKILTRNEIQNITRNKYFVRFMRLYVDDVSVIIIRFFGKRSSSFALLNFFGKVHYIVSFLGEINEEIFLS